MLLIRRWLSLCLLAPLWALAQGSVVKTAEVQAELVAHAPEGVAPGKALWLGLLLRHAPHWHTYWKNPGDSGLPTTFAWQLPAGVVAGPIEWPTPERLPVGPLVNYGYEGTVLLPVPVTVPSEFAAAVLEVQLRADWLVCREVCIPQSGDFKLALAARSTTVAQAGLFAAARASAPREWPGVAATAQAAGQALALEVRGLPAGLRGKPVQFFAEDAGVIDHAGPLEQRWQGDALWLRMPLSPQRSASPDSMRSVIRATGEGGGIALGFAVAAWPAAGGTAAAVAQTAATGLPVDPGMSLPLALAFALVGGLLLNLMPCVFPVLSLKVLGFARHAGDRPQLIAGGLAYTAGVVLSFVALAGLLLALRAGGAALGWGFQLQSPAFVAGLALLFTLIGLNLLGVFELAGALPGNLGTLRLRHPLADHALTGVFAVAVASPCTAPFMGAALGVALTQTAPQALAVFAALGLGMAAPYLAACLWPGLSRALPRPGAWMGHFKTVMAFPMFATVVWLLWVLGQQVGVDSAALVLALLLAVAFAVWVAGSRAMGARARVSLGAVAAVFIMATAWWALPTMREAPAGAGSAAVQTPASTRWASWSPDALARVRAEGHPVFVDFTAAWCVTCQFNKRTTLGDANLLADFEARGVRLMRADWTKRDAAIARELQRLGRSGVPVYALYAPRAAEPQLLSEMPSVAEVRAAMARWGTAPAAQRAVPANPIP